MNVNFITRPSLHQPSSRVLCRDLARCIIHSFFSMQYKFYSDSVLIAECDNVKYISHDLSI